MAFWRIAFTICCGLSLAGSIRAADINGQLADRIETDRYDFVLELSPAKPLGETAAVHVTLEATDKASIGIAITTAAITISNVQKKARTLLATVDNPGIVPGTPCRITVMRRENMLGLLRDNILLYRGTVPRGPGNLAGVTRDAGWESARDPRIQRLEPVHFEDDFMRAGADQDLWTKTAGRWEMKTAWDDTPQGAANASANAAAGYGQNPFALVGCAGGDGAGPAKATTGDPFWEDYSYSVAVQPNRDTVAGLLVNMTDAGNGLLVRWTPVIDSRHPGRLTLQRLVNGKAADLIAESAGGFIPRQWYRLAIVSSLTGVTVLVDGVERLRQADLTPWRGGIGLYAEGLNGVIFDDVRVFGRTFDADLLFETQQTELNKRFENDPNGMAIWSNPQSEWRPTPELSGHFWGRRDIFGDEQWITLTVKPLPIPTGELWLSLQGDGTNTASGLRAVAQLLADPARVVYILYQDDRQLASKTIKPPPSPDSDYIFHFRRSGTDVSLEVDGDIVVRAGGISPASGLRPAYRATGAFAGVREQVVLSRHMLDYTFSNAPTDWLYDGTWEPTIRWSCSPNWSFLGGWSRGDAVLWHKQRFTGDQDFEAFIGLKMEYPRQREPYDNRYHDFNLTICGDGRDPRSGYTGIYVTADKKMALYRNGVEVAREPLPVECIPTRGANHRSWFNPRLSKRGNTVTFTVTFAWLPVKDAAGTVLGPRTMTLTWLDDQPIAGGVPAIWTLDNGITISRASIDFAEPPAPRTEPLLALPQPWFPEWANVGEPLVLEMSDLWTTAEAPVRLSVTPRGVPTPDEGSVRADGARITFTPRQADSAQKDRHWYEIKATAGDLVSPSAHLDLHVFDPKSYPRDDSHAQVLYRFNEGQGDLIRDQSGHAPAADLKIAPLPNATGGVAGRALSAPWLPGQGVMLRPTSRVATENAAGMDRLLQAIRESGACTIEFWASIESVYFPSRQNLGYAAAFFSWDLPGVPKDSQRNLTLMQMGAGMALYTKGETIVANNNLIPTGQVQIALTHLVISWDGTKTSVYRNGELVHAATISWNLDKMAPGSRLLLGNSADDALAYAGAVYFLAFHDRAFTPDDARRHYLAGPSGR